MKVCITGISGFVGSAIAKALYQGDHDIIGFVRDKRDLPNEILEQFTIHTCDITGKIPKIDCDILIHTISPRKKRQMSALLDRVNVKGTRNLLEHIQAKHIIYISCASVYSMHDDLHKEDELIDIEVLSSYGRSKRRTENLLLENELPCTILRASAIYGKGDALILPKLFKLYRSSTLHIPGNAHVQVSLTNLDKIVQTVLHCINAPIDGKQIFNVVDEEPYLLDDTLKLLFSTLLNKPIQIKETSEQYARIKAGLYTVVNPGSELTQYTIDYLTKPLVLSTERYQAHFKHIQTPTFESFLPSYKQWIDRHGLRKILKANTRLNWL